jgi:hypothetical protein
MMGALRATAPLLVLVCLHGRAEAHELECGLTEPGVITVDGLLSDWQGVSGLRRADANPQDASFVVRCNHDAEAVYLSVEVTDDLLIRTSRPAGDDRLVFGFGPERLEVYPTHRDAGQALKVKWQRPASTKGILVADSLLPRGWSVEAAFPLGRVPGWHKGLTAFPFSLELGDADLRVDSKVQTTLSTGGGLIVFAEGGALYQQFLKEHRIRPADVKVDTLANMDGEPGQERVVVGGKVIGILGEEYVYFVLPVVSGKDVLEVKILDLAGEGKSSALVRYVERGGGGSREVLSVWNLLPDGSIARTFAHELGKELGPARITGTYSLVARSVGKGKKKKAAPGHDIVVTCGSAVGFSAQNWNELPAEDMQPILLPWMDKKQSTWHFRGDEAFGGE